MISDTQRDKLIKAACEARKQAYAPYSNYAVGAAILVEDGRIYDGVNVENASYGLANCAERTAIFSAVTDGETEFEAIAVCADGQTPTPPCGACRQVLAEFASEIPVLSAYTDGEHEWTMGDLLPAPFHLGGE